MGNTSMAQLYRDGQVGCVDIVVQTIWGCRRLYGWAGPSSIARRGGRCGALKGTLRSRADDFTCQCAPPLAPRPAPLG